MKRLLIIANKKVFPSLDGGSLAIKNLAEKFSKLDYKIDLIAISKTNKNQSPLKSIESKVDKNINQIVFYKKMSLNLIEFIKSIIYKSSYQANRFYHNDIQKYIQNLININNYQIILFESIFTTVYLKSLNLPKSLKIIFRAHNIEHEIWNNLAQKHFFKKIVYLFLAQQIKKLEQITPRHVDYIFTISTKDYVFFQQFFPKKTHNIPVTFDIENNQVKKIKNSIVHLGAMDWKPNLDGIDWFIKFVFPKIVQSEKYVNIYIAGKKMPEKYLNHPLENTKIQSEIKNAKTYIANKEVLFVPLFSGSGIRIKILEGMALGIPVITTSKGAQGIPCTHGKDILIADTPDSFFQAIELLINNKSYAKKIGINGQKIISKYFSEKVVVNKIDSLIQ